MKDENEVRGERLKTLREKAGLSQAALAEKCGWASQSRVGNYEKGVRKIGADDAAILATALMVHPAEILFGLEPVNNVIPAPIGLRQIPIISYVQAGCWTESCECRAMDGSIETITTDLDLGSMAFALEVRGDSMAPEILEGDVVVIDPDVDPLPGDIVAAKNGSHEATIKQYRPRGTNDQGQEYFELVPLNPVYPTMRSDHHHVTIIGVMMERRRYRRRKS